MRLKKSRFVGALVAAVLSVGIVTASSTVVYADTYAVNSVEDEAPSNFSCKKTSTSITLSWDAVGSADAYKVFMYNPSTKKFEKYKSISKTSCKITGLSKGTKYYFKVAVLKKVKIGNGNYGYNEGTYSKKISVTTKSSDAPASPSSNFTGFKSADGSKFYFNNGKLVTGWQNIDGNTYYFDKSSYAAKTGWLTVKNKDYYFYNDGKMVTNATIIVDGNAYTFNSDGSLNGERAAYDRLSDDAKKLVDSLCKYIDHFKDPSSVRVRSAYKHSGLGYSESVEGYWIEVSGNNSYGGTTVTWYFLRTGGALSNDPIYIFGEDAVMWHLGLNNHGKSGPRNIYGRWTDEIDLNSSFEAELKLINKAISDYIEEELWY